MITARPPLTSTFAMELAHSLIPGLQAAPSLFLHCLQVSVFPLCNSACLPWYCLCQLILYGALRQLQLMELRSMTFCMFKHICQGDCSNLNTTDATLHSRSLLQALVLSSCHESHGHRGRNKIKVRGLSPAAPPLFLPHCTSLLIIELN